MTSIQSLWALTSHLGIDPTELLANIGEKVVADASGKSFIAIGQRMVGSARAVFLQLEKKIKDNFPDYLRQQIKDIDQSQRSAIIENAFAEWIQSHASEAAELERMLFRIVYLHTLADYCSNLPVIGGLENRLNLEKVWIPQTYITVSSGQLRQTHTGGARFDTLNQAIASCGTPLILSGVSGMGKSTQLRKLMLDLAHSQLDTTNFEQILADPLPIYLKAETLIHERVAFTTALSNATGVELGLSLPFPIPDGFFDPRQPGAPRSFFIAIDGLDEISPSQRDELIIKIKSHGDQFRFLLASRPTLAWSQFVQIELEEPSHEHAATLIRKLASDHETNQPVDLVDLPRNPLVLTLMALLKHEKVSSRAVLYREFIIDRLMRSHELVFRNPQLGFELLQAAACLDSDLSQGAERITAELKLLPDEIDGIARNRKAKAMLVSTGIIMQEGERLRFIHESFRSYLRAEAMAREHRPEVSPWRVISPFREGWETVVFTIEIWRREGREIAVALEDLFAFGTSGLGTIAQIASRDANLPLPLIDRAIAKCMYVGERDWDPGYINGPIQNLTQMAIHYEAARIVLREIAQDEFTYSEDAAYAAQGLAKAGFEQEALTFLVAICRENDIYCRTRVLAAELLAEIGAKAEALSCAEELAIEWANDPPDTSWSWMALAEFLHNFGKKKVATNILNRLDAELDDEFELAWLAQTYLNLGKRRKAKGVALRAFNTMRWSRELTVGGDSQSTELAVLLERVGALRELNQVRHQLEYFKLQKNGTLQAGIINIGQKAKDPFNCVGELLIGSENSALEVLKSQLFDVGIPRHERFSVVPELLASPFRTEVVEILKQIAKDEPSCRIESGRALVHGGEPDLGCKILAKVALEPAESAATRTRAIEQLVQSGRIDLAISAFRRLRYSGRLEPNCLDRIASAFAHTSVWDEMLEHCKDLLLSDVPFLRIEAVNILMREDWREDQSEYAKNILRNIILNRNNHQDVRLAAVHSLDKLDSEFAVDLSFGITTSSEETMEAGIAAMQFLYCRSDFLLIDGGNDVVWDRKLSVDQFIEAAHAFLSLIRYIHNAKESPFYGMTDEAVTEALKEIAADSNQPIERRFAAARLKFPVDFGNRFNEPFWPGIDAICLDETTPIELRRPAIQYAVLKDPERFEHWVNMIETGRINHIDAAYLYLAAGRDNEAGEKFHLALSDKLDLHMRIRIWEELVNLGESGFSGKEAAKFLSDSLGAAEIDDFESEYLEELMTLCKTALTADEYIELAKTIAKHEGLDSYEIFPAARALIECGAQQVLRLILEARKISAKRRMKSDYSMFYEFIFIHNIQAQLVSRDDAAKALSDMYSNPQFSVSQKAYICGALSRIGSASIASDRLRKLFFKCTNLEENLDVAQAAIEIHDWALARKIFLALANDPSISLSKRLQISKGLLKVGLKERAIHLLSSVDFMSDDFVSNDGLIVLITCGQNERAIKICHEYIGKDGVCISDKMRLIEQLGATVHKEIARNFLIDLIAEKNCDISERARGAELLYNMAFKAEAHSILFGLVDSAVLDNSDLLSIADALVCCSLPITAQRILKSINIELLDSGQKDYFRGVESHINSLWR